GRHRAVARTNQPQHVALAVVAGADARPRHAGAGELDRPGRPRHAVALGVRGGVGLDLEAVAGGDDHRAAQIDLRLVLGDLRLIGADLEIAPGPAGDGDPSPDEPRPARLVREELVVVDPDVLGRALLPVALPLRALDDRVLVGAGRRGGGRRRAAGPGRNAHPDGK